MKINEFKRKLALAIIKWSGLRMWGCKLETKLPPEFVITKHAEERLCDRMPMFEPERLVVEAWQNGMEPGEWWKPQFRYGFKCVYREYKATVFVFRTTYNKNLGYAQKHLVTIYNKI